MLRDHGIFGLPSMSLRILPLAVFLTRLPTDHNYKYSKLHLAQKFCAHIKQLIFLKKKVLVYQLK